MSSPIIGHLNGKGFGFVVLDGVFDTAVADFCWAKAIVYTSPTVATIGMSITIPLALITDFLIYHEVPTGVSIGGALLVIIGFVLVNLDDKTVFGKDILSNRGYP
jgi:solute carrier family 35 protein F5